MQDFYSKLHECEIEENKIYSHYLDVVRGRIIETFFTKTLFAEQMREHILSWLIQEKFSNLSEYQIFRSEVFCNKRRPFIVAFFIGVEKGFYSDYIYLFEGDPRTAFIFQTFCVVFDKWRDICENDLYTADSNMIMDYNALLQLTAQDMTMGVGIPNYDIYNLISSLRSEGTHSRGAIGFIKSEDDVLREFIRFHYTDRPSLEKNNARYIRKLLEMTSSIEQSSGNEYILVCDEKYILGISRREYVICDYVVEFNGFLNWTLTYKGKERFSYCEGNYLYRSFYHDDTLKAINEFLKLGKVGYEKFKILVESAAKQKHGTMLIVFQNTEDVKAETERLISFHRGIKLQYTMSLSEKSLLLSLSSIDGAIFIDKELNCYGFGMIVDGEACVYGTAERGARFNSGKNYVHCCWEKGYPCLAVVVSEDRTIDAIFPNQENRVT